VITVRKRYRWTDGRTDDIQSHNRALRIALRGKNTEKEEKEVSLIED